MSDRVCNVFISHLGEDDHRLAPLKEMLASKGCIARDYSVNSSTPNNAKDPDYIKQEILKPRIDQCGTLIVLITPETKDSDWVSWEIEYAHQQGKRIVGVWDHGEKGCDLPERLDEYADEVVAWQPDKIIDAIFDDVDDWQDPDGRPTSKRKITRYSC